MPKAVANSTSPVSLFHNLSIGELVDQLGNAKAEVAEVKAREDAPGRTHRPRHHRGGRSSLPRLTQRKHQMDTRQRPYPRGDGRVVVHIA